MKNTLYKYKYVCAVLTAAVVLTVFGCTKRNLSERPVDGPLKINLIWPGNQSVIGARIWLYGSDGVLYSATECSAGGYEGRVPADTYTVLVANSDCANAYCHRSESWREHCMKAGMNTETNTLLHVGNVFCIGTQEVTVLRGNRPTEVTLYPKNTVKKLHFRIATDYIDDIIDINVRMTGIVPSVRLIDGDDTGEPTGEVLAAAKSEASGLYSADMSVFGWRGENLVTATVRHTDGKEETTVPQDLSEQLGQLPEEGGTVDITLALTDGREIPLTVTVKAWESGSGSGTVI